MPKRKRASHRKVQTSTQPVVLRLLEYEITEEPILTKQYRELPPHAKEGLDQLYGLVHDHPDKAIDEIQAWIQRYPDMPVLYNYLSVAYSNIGDYRKAEETVLANFQKNPDYLFARLNYAGLLLHQQEYTKVAELLDHKFDLQAFYPHRRRFHISEFVGFMSVVGRYFAGVEQREMAAQIYDTLRKLAPDHPSTQQLRLELRPSLRARLLRYLRKRLAEGSEQFRDG